MKTKVLSVVAALALLAVANSTASAVTVTQVKTTVDIGAGTVDFQITYNGTPDFFTTDSAGRQADQFQFSIESATVQFPPGGSVLTNQNLSIFIVYPPNDGTVVATLPITLSGDVVDFTVTLALLLQPTGQFPEQHFYSFVSDGIAVEGTVPTPFPSALPLFATGLVGLGLLGWRRKKKAIAA
jgi:hypothetical protein